MNSATGGSGSIEENQTTSVPLVGEGTVSNNMDNMQSESEMSNALS